jgi:hypothetical protein
MRSCSTAAVIARSSRAGELLTKVAAQLAQDVSSATQQIRQIANGCEDRLRIVTDELMEFETLMPVIKAPPDPRCHAPVGIPVDRKRQRNPDAQRLYSAQEAAEIRRVSKQQIDKLSPDPA